MQNDDIITTVVVFQVIPVARVSCFAHSFVLIEALTKGERMKIAETVMQLLKPVIEGLGYELAEVSYKKEQGNMMLELYIDKEDGVTIEDCEKVSRAVDPILDEKDPIPDSYFMAVYSLGIDRPLRTDKDLGRNIGEMVTVKLYAPLNEKKEYVGKLASFDESSITLDCDGSKVKIGRKDASSIKLYLDFNTLQTEE